MSETVELKLYSPLQVDIIERDSPGHIVPLQALNRERKEEYSEQVMSAVQRLQLQEEAENAFDMERDWSEISEKIISFTRTVELVHGELYGIFSCQSRGELDTEETDLLKCACRSRWEEGWGAGYTYCPGEDSSRGLYIRFWQDYGAPLLTLKQLEAVQTAEQSIPAVTEITPDTFWTLLDQAKNARYQELKRPVYWLTDQLLALGSEQARKFHRIMIGYLELSKKYGLWTAAILMREDGCSGGAFREFREQLILQGRETYLAALRNPDSLADISTGEVHHSRSLLYVGYHVYRRLTGHLPHDGIHPADHQYMLAELKKDIVYSEGIEYPYEWPEVAAYLPRLTAQHLTPEELRACICRGHMWNHDDPAIQKARVAAPKKKKARTGKKKGGETR